MKCFTPAVKLDSVSSEERKKNIRISDALDYLLLLQLPLCLSLIYTMAVFEHGPVLVCEPLLLLLGRDWGSREMEMGFHDGTVRKI